jgi:hypothetical protein
MHSGHRNASGDIGNDDGSEQNDNRNNGQKFNKRESVPFPEHVSHFSFSFQKSRLHNGPIWGKTFFLSGKSSNNRFGLESVITRELRGRIAEHISLYFKRLPPATAQTVVCRKPALSSACDTTPSLILSNYYATQIIFQGMDVGEMKIVVRQ